MAFDRFQVCVAYYRFAAEWHRGARSSEYAILGRLCELGFKPGAAASGRLDKEDWPDARDLLARLIRKARAGEEVGRGRNYKSS